MEKTFSHLRVSSEYSITQGLLTINQLVDCAKKYSVPSIALTDKSNMFAPWLKYMLNNQPPGYLDAG